MKIQLIIDEKLQDTEIHIYARQYDEQTERLMKQLQEMQTTTIIDGYPATRNSYAQNQRYLLHIR